MDAVAAAMTQAKSTIATPGASFKGGVPLSVPAPVALAVANEL